MPAANFFGWARTIQKIKKSEFNEKKDSEYSRYITSELPGFADFLNEIGFDSKDGKYFEYRNIDLDSRIYIEIFEHKENNLRFASPLYFSLKYRSKLYKNNIYFRIERNYRNFMNNKDNKIIILPVYSTEFNVLRDAEYEGYIYQTEDDSTTLHIMKTTDNCKYSLKSEYFEINRKVINSKYWKIPLIEFREIYFPHQRLNEDLFNIFYPMEIRDKHILCVPIYIKSKVLNKLQRFKLHEEISNFLDVISLFVCIMFALSSIKYTYLKLIEKRLFKPWYLNLSKNLKDCEDMDRFPFVDVGDIDRIIYLALSIFETQNIYYMEVDKEIITESITLFMREMYKEHEKIERKINHFIQIHENIPTILLTIIGVIIGFMQIKSIL